MADQRLAFERQLDDFEPRLDVLRRLAKKPQRVPIGLELARCRRRRVAPDATRVEAQQKQLCELFPPGACGRARVGLRLIGEPHLAPLLGPMIAVEARERVRNRRGILRENALERAEPPGPATDLRLDLIERALA